MRGEDSRGAKAGQWGRAAEVEALAKLAESLEQGQGLRSVAKEIGVARSTLRHWRARKERIDEDPAVVALFESPSGLAWLHRLVLASVFVFGKVGPCGAPMLSAFLRLSGIGRFVASSVGSVHKVSTAISDQIIDFGEQERGRLAAEMPERQIAVALDENFHQAVCLVAMEPASGFILCEQVEENREAATWDAAMAKACKGLRVTVAVGGSDEAAALKQHIAKTLGAVHAPDLFHQQRELWRAMEPALGRSLKAPERALPAAESALQYWQDRHAKHLVGDRGPGRPPQFERHIAEATAVLEARRADLKEAADRQAKAHEAIRSISQVYHPVDLTTGAIRTASSMESSLATAFATLQETADALGLDVRQRARLQKAQRLTPKMVSHLAFFWHHIDRCLDGLPLPEAAAALAREALIPGLYLKSVAARARTADQRGQLRQLSATLLSGADDLTGALLALPPTVLSDLRGLAADAVHLFLRATSCVEGRNGRLALLQHGSRFLGTKRRRALTVLHNFAIHRPDGSTPASRFFRQPHRDLFAFLLDHLDLPLRPRPSASHASALTRGWANL